MIEWSYQWLIDGYIQLAIVATSMAVMVFSFLMTSAWGRSILRGVWDVFKKRPVMFVFCTVFIFVLMAYAGTKPPPVIVEKGIELIDCVQTPQSVRFDWRAEDSRIRAGDMFQIQERRGDDWYTIGQTTNTTFTYPVFTIQKYRQWRIAVDIGEVGE